MRVSSSCARFEVLAWMVGSGAFAIVLLERDKLLEEELIAVSLMLFDRLRPKSV